jgi:cytochrome P450
MQKNIPKFLVFPFQDMKNIVSFVQEKLEDQHEVIELIGYPIRVFCLKDPSLTQEIYLHPEVGITKLPKVLPRVQIAMGNTGGYILSGGDAWKKRRALVQPAMSNQQIEHYLSLVEPIVTAHTTEWEHAVKNGSLIDVFETLRRIIVDFSLQMLFSGSFSKETIKKTEEATLYIDKNFLRLVPLSLPTPGNLRFKKFLSLIHDLFDSEMQRVRSSENSSRSISSRKT